MEARSGLYKALFGAAVYAGFQVLVGSRKAHDWIVNDVCRSDSGDVVVDFGCGTGDISRLFPNGTSYIGFDVNPEYIEAARRKHGTRAEFVRGSIRECTGYFIERSIKADVVLCVGVLHHLSDVECHDLMAMASGILAPLGRFVALEPVYLLRQSGISRWIMSKDRGQIVRKEQDYRKLMSGAFNAVTTDVVTNLIRLPYVHVLLQGRNQQ